MRSVEQQWALGTNSSSTTTSCVTLTSYFKTITILLLWEILQKQEWSSQPDSLYTFDVQSCNRVQLFATPWTAACQASLSFTISQSLFKFMSTESVMPSNHLILCHLLLLLPSIFPSIRVFSNELALCIRWPKFWSFTLSISSSNEYSGLIFFRIDWLISLQTKGLSKLFSSITVRKHQFSVLSLLYGPALTSIYDYWKNQSFDNMDCQQSDVSAF